MCAMNNVRFKFRVGFSHIIADYQWVIEVNVVSLMIFCTFSISMIVKNWNGLFRVFFPNEPILCRLIARINPLRSRLILEQRWLKSDSVSRFFSTRERNGGVCVCAERNVYCPRQYICLQIARILSIHWTRNYFICHVILFKPIIF